MGGSHWSDPMYYNGGLSAAWFVVDVEIAMGIPTKELDKLEESYPMPGE